MSFCPALFSGMVFLLSSTLSQHGGFSFPSLLVPSSGKFQKPASVCPSQLLAVGISIYQLGVGSKKLCADTPVSSFGDPALGQTHYTAAVNLLRYRPAWSMLAVSASISQYQLPGSSCTPVLSQGSAPVETQSDPQCRIHEGSEERIFGVLGNPPTHTHTNTHTRILKTIYH